MAYRPEGDGTYPPLRSISEADLFRAYGGLRRLTRETLLEALAADVDADATEHGDGLVLVAGVLYDAETLEEADRVVVLADVTDRRR